MKVLVSKIDLNFVRRIGKKGAKPRPVVVSLISNMRKRDLLQNARKLKGSRIFVNEDMDKETQLERKELLKFHLHFKEKGHDSKMRRNGLLLDGKFCHVSDLIKTAGLTRTSEDDTEGYDKEDQGEEEGISLDVKTPKKRKRLKKTSPKFVKYGDSMEMVRRRSESISSVQSQKK